MHDVVATLLVAVAAFFGTMTDNFVAFSAQLAITPAAKHRRASVGHFVGVGVLVILSAGAGTALSEFPVRWVGILALAPALLAVHAWRTRHDANRSVARGTVATGLVTIAFGGDNLAVWIPLLRANGVLGGTLIAGVFVLLDLVLIGCAEAFARRPRVIEFSQRWAPMCTPFLYGFLAVIILWQCQWF